MSFEIQNASVLKRIAALLLDLIFLAIIATGVMLAISAITGYDDYTIQMDDSANFYAEQHNIKTFYDNGEIKNEIFADKYDVKSLKGITGVEIFDTIKSEYNNLPKEAQDTYRAASTALSNDQSFLRARTIAMNLFLLIPSLGIFFAYAITEFAVPLLLKNGQTLGKKAMALGVVRCDGVKMTPFMLFIRTLLGKYTVETMIPLALLFLNGVFGLAGLIVVGLLAVMELVLLIVTKQRTVIHDAFAQTVVVDLPSQMIFDTPEALLAYKRRIAAERAADADREDTTTPQSAESNQD